MNYGKTLPETKVDSKFDESVRMGTFIFKIIGQLIISLEQLFWFTGDN